MQPKSKMVLLKTKAVLINLFVFALSIGIALLIGEGLIRLLYKKNMALFPRYHTDAHYGDYTIRRIRPNMHFTHTSYDGSFHFTTNDQGFRNTENISYAKQAGELRVLSIGDSHTQGYEVNQEQTFSYVTEALLKKKGVPATVINAGVSGFSTAEELVFLENEGYKYHPDYVVLGFYANDLVDNLKADLFRVNGDSLVVHSRDYAPGVKIQNKLYKYSVFRYLGEHSYLYAFLFNLVWDHFKKASKENAKERVTEYAVASSAPVSDQSKKLADKLIVRLDNFCKAHGMKLIILDIPQIGIKSSIPQSSVPTFKANCDTLFYAKDLSGEYQKLHVVHVPHGNRHISAEVHQLLAQKIASYISQDRNL